MRMRTFGSRSVEQGGPGVFCSLAVCRRSHDFVLLSDFWETGTALARGEFQSGDLGPAGLIIDFGQDSVQGSAANSQYLRRPQAVPTRALENLLGVANLHLMHG